MYSAQFLKYTFSTKAEILPNLPLLHSMRFQCPSEGQIFICPLWFQVAQTGPLFRKIQRLTCSTSWWMRSHSFFFHGVELVTIGINEFFIQISIVFLGLPKPSTMVQFLTPPLSDLCPSKGYRSLTYIHHYPSGRVLRFFGKLFWTWAHHKN